MAFNMVYGVRLICGSSKLLTCYNYTGTWGALFYRTDGNHSFKFLTEALVTVSTLMSFHQNQIDESFSDKALTRSMFNDLAEM